MARRVLWTVVLILGTAMTASCGDDGDDGTTKAGTSGGKAGTTGGEPMKIECTGAGEVACGTKCCGVSPGVMAEACCADDFAGECGMLGGFGAQRACVRAVAADPGCPSVTIPVINFVLPSCCNDANMCGIDASVFGMSGCTELGEASMRAMQAMMMAQQPPAAGTTGAAGSDEDGGVAGAGGRTGTAGRPAGGRMGFPGPMFPAPQACKK